MSELELNRDQYLELEKLALGAFLPLTGFMNEDQFHGAVHDLHLPGGEVFPLPVVLDATEDVAAAMCGRPRVALTFRGEEVGEVSPESFFRCDKAAVSRKVFGTDDASHPGVAHLLEMGEVFVGGPVKLSRRAEFDISRHELTPEETKAIFAERGWETIAGFQTRNVPHRAHEYLQRVALENVDGLFIQPLVGRKKAGDYNPSAIMAAYRALIDGFYPAEHVVLGILSTAMRYAGPREAVFHAIIRRNYGCTEFVVGRDHAGVNDYYEKYAAHELTRRLEPELGIRIMALQGPFHCATCGGIVTEKTCRHFGQAPEVTRQISGTDIRAMLTRGKSPDPDLIRPEIIDSVSGYDLFITEDER